MHIFYFNNNKLLMFILICIVNATHITRLTVLTSQIEKPLNTVQFRFLLCCTRPATRILATFRRRRKAQWEKHIKLSVMKDQIPRKHILSKRRLSTIFEWEEDEFAKRRGKTVAGSKSRRAVRRSLTAHELHDSGIQVLSRRTAEVPTNRAKFAAALRAPSTECSSQSPLKGTPWEEAGVSSVPSLSSSATSQRKNRNMRHQRSTKKQDSVEFWLKFFG